MDSETENGRSGKGGGRAYRSRLEPFVDFIRAQRQQRKTWVEIAERLGADKGCAISFQGLHQFYRRHLKRQARTHWEDEPVLSRATHPNGSANGPTASNSVLAATPIVRPFRRPNANDITLNDPTKI